MRAWRERRKLRDYHFFLFFVSVKRNLNNFPFSPPFWMAKGKSWYMTTANDWIFFFAILFCEMHIISVTLWEIRTHRHVLVAGLLMVCSSSWADWICLSSLFCRVVGRHFAISLLFVNPSVVVDSNFLKPRVYHFHSYSFFYLFCFFSLVAGHKEGWRLHT